MIERGSYFTCYDYNCVYGLCSSVGSNEFLGCNGNY